MKRLFLSLIIIAALALTGCTPAERQTASTVASAAASLVCPMIPVFDDNAEGALVGTFCKSLLDSIAGGLAPAAVASSGSVMKPSLAAALPYLGTRVRARLRRAPASPPCDELVTYVDAGGHVVAHVCPAYDDDAASKLAGKAKRARG